MSVSVRKYEDGKTKGYEVDVVARLPDGRTKRSRTRLAAATKDAAVRWGQQRLTEVLNEGGFTRVRRAAETPFNLVLDVRP